MLTCMYAVEIEMKVRAGILGLKRYLLLLEEGITGRPFTAMPLVLVLDFCILSHDSAPRTHQAVSCPACDSTSTDLHSGSEPSC